MSAPVPVADVAAGQRQILRDLAAEYGRQLRQILQVGELVKGSVYPIETRYRQSPQDAELFAQALRALPVESWWEDWMRHADRLLEDPELVNIVHQVQLKRRPKSRTRGRLSTPTEVVLRLMVLKHIRNWSYGVLAREVRANLVYRQFTRLGHHRMPHAKTLGNPGLLLGPAGVDRKFRKSWSRAIANCWARPDK